MVVPSPETFECELAWSNPTLRMKLGEPGQSASSVEARCSLEQWRMGGIQSLCLGLG